MRPSSAVRALAAVSAALGLAACAHHPRPERPASLVRPAPPSAVSEPRLDNFGRLILPIGSTLLIEGDQTAYAPAFPRDRTSVPPINGVQDRRLPHAWPGVLARRLGRKVQVTEAVYPGDMARDGVTRWSTTPPADVTILMYGLNEATREDYPLPPAQFASAMKTLIARAQANGGWVVLVVPPPFPAEDLDRGLNPYRDVIRALGHEPRTLLFDPGAALRATGGAWSGKRRLSDRGQEVVGQALAGLIVMAPRAPREEPPTVDVPTGAAPAAVVGRG